MNAAAQRTPAGRIRAAALDLYNALRDLANAAEARIRGDGNVEGLTEAIIAARAALAKAEGRV